jgi:hypothetical protein
MSHYTVVRERTENGIEQYDVFSRLLEDRIIPASELWVAWDEANAQLELTKDEKCAFQRSWTPVSG